ncbi:unnamed protein product [Orchesella dallaii]|uniref:Uncharacterized protein n=1 Tax=Orchesella dallaii TaxID=48710 RepID=A0ABP1Q2Y0_9HEXA
MAHGKRIPSSTPLTSNSVDSDNLENAMDWELSGINGSIALLVEDPVIYSEELFNTPESESENSQSESENDENPDNDEDMEQMENESLEAPTYSQITETLFSCE